MMDHPENDEEGTVTVTVTQEMSRHDVMHKILETLDKHGK